MADMKIKVTPGELEQCAKKFQSCSEEMQKAYNRVNDAINNCKWEGPARNACITRTAELIKNLKTSDATMAQAVKGLTTAAQIYSEVEAANEGKVAKLTQPTPFTA